jgi:hypothetical protein
MQLNGKNQLLWGLLKHWAQKQRQTLPSGQAYLYRSVLMFLRSQVRISVEATIELMKFLSFPQLL